MSVQVSADRAWVSRPRLRSEPVGMHDAPQLQGEVAAVAGRQSELGIWLRCQSNTFLIAHGWRNPIGRSRQIVTRWQCDQDTPKIKKERLRS